jgi:hypothetical protein
MYTKKVMEQGGMKLAFWIELQQQAQDIQDFDNLKI